MLIPDFGEDRPNVGHESHIGHAVRLVDDDRLDVAQSDRSLLQKVQQASWTGDSDIDPPLERTELFAETNSSIEGSDTSVIGLTENREFHGNLRRELASRSEHEGPGVARACPLHSN
ncbi:MAG: hypothetical protein WB770_09715, partial [Acidimicrobiales bacterium]